MHSHSLLFISGLGNHLLWPNREPILPFFLETGTKQHLYPRSKGQSQLYLLWVFRECLFRSYFFHHNRTFAQEPLMLWLVLFPHGIHFVTGPTPLAAIKIPKVPTASTEMGISAVIITSHRHGKCCLLLGVKIWHFLCPPQSVVLPTCKQKKNVSPSLPIYGVCIYMWVCVRLLATTSHPFTEAWAQALAGFAYKSKKCQSSLGFSSLKVLVYNKTAPRPVAMIVGWGMHPPKAEGDVWLSWWPK